MPVKLSEKVTAFNLDEINEWCERINGSAMDALKRKRILG
jgi:predicted DNA-binding transcriptional regulator AlpA